MLTLHKIKCDLKRSDRNKTFNMKAKIWNMVIVIGLIITLFGKHRFIHTITATTSNLMLIKKSKYYFTSLDKSTFDIIQVYPLFCLVKKMITSVATNLTSRNLKGSMNSISNVLGPPLILCFKYLRKVKMEVIYEHIVWKTWRMFSPTNKKCSPLWPYISCNYLSIGKH